MQATGNEVILSGTIILGEEPEPFEGYLCIEEGIIKEIGTEKVEARLEGIVCPCLVNAHTHLGDSIIKDPPFAPLGELVGPKGLKHRTLEGADRQDLVDGMRSSLREMIGTGTCAFADFREGGPAGADMLFEALEGLPLKSRILGRPDPGSVEVHQDCWGIGISSTRDHPTSWLEEVVAKAKSSGKKVALHAGESGRDDVEEALGLQPDLLVHLTQASVRDLEEVAQAKVPVVVSPRSNLMTGVGLPEVARMIELGITVGLGTDNVMLNSPNMFSEMEFASKALLHDDKQVFKMCTLNGARILGIEEDVGTIEIGKVGRVMVIDRRSDNMRGSADPLASLVRRARPSDILAVF